MNYDVIGFKDTKYILPEFDTYLDYLNEIFPSSFFVFLKRNPNEVAESGFYREFDSKRVIETLKFTDQRFAAAEQAFGPKKSLMLERFMF